MLILGSALYGVIENRKQKANGFHPSFFLPYNPYVHKTLIYRAVMSSMQYFGIIYCMVNLPEKVVIALLALLPFFVAIFTLTFETEMLTRMQLVSLIACYLGLLLVTNP